MVHPSQAASVQISDAAVFRPPRSLGVIIGGAFSAWALLLAALSLRLGLASSAEFKTFLALAAAGLLFFLAAAFANWAYGVYSLAYIVDSESLTIQCGFRTIVIPLAAIQRMLPGRNLEHQPINGLNWWGCHIGHAESERLGYTLFYSTHSAPEEVLYVVTNDESYAITVLDQPAFAAEVQQRARLRAAPEAAQRSDAHGLAALPFWRDRVAVTATALGVLACVVLSGYIYWEYPGLPSVIQLSFPALGGMLRVGSKTELLRIVYLGSGILALNTVVGVLVHARERAAGLWLLSSSAILQAVLLAASLIAIQRS